MKNILHIFVLSLLFTFNAYAQRTEEVRDTLSALRQLRKLPVL